MERWLQPASHPLRTTVINPKNRWLKPALRADSFSGPPTQNQGFEGVGSGGLNLGDFTSSLFDACMILVISLINSLYS